MYSERYNKNEDLKYQLKQYWIERLQKGVELKASVEGDLFDSNLVQQMLQHLINVIDIQPLESLQDRQAMRSLMNTECIKVLDNFVKQAHSSSTVIPENLHINIPAADNDPMEISIEPRKRKAEREPEEERPEKYQEVSDEEEIKQAQEEVMIIDEQNQNQLIEIDELRNQLQMPDITPYIVQGIVNRIAQLKLEIYEQEQYIRSRLIAWDKRQKH